MFGPLGLINNKYWSNILAKSDYVSKTVVFEAFNINKKEDYDIYFEDIINNGYKWAPRFLKKRFINYFAFDYIVKNFDIVHVSCLGLSLQTTRYRRKEAQLLKRFGCKIVVIPYGADFMQYSQILDLSYRHALLSHYPDLVKKEKQIHEDVTYWVNNCDVFIGSLILDGKPRWDVLPFCNLSINVKEWQMKEKRNMSDGTDGEVVIVHSPNHRVIKGTEFVLKAVESLREKGLKIKLRIIEKVKNDEVLKILREEADILVEQLLLGYALNGIEGMATGLPVISNISNERYSLVYKRYSYLGECPIASANPETIEKVLETLVRNPKLRIELGNAGRKYVEKYHSEENAVYMFGNIYDKIWYNKADTNLMELYNPQNKGSYNNRTERIQFPKLDTV